MARILFSLVLYGRIARYSSIEMSDKAHLERDEWSGDQCQCLRRLETRRLWHTRRRRIRQKVSQRRILKVLPCACARQAPFEYEWQTHEERTSVDFDHVEVPEQGGITLPKEAVVREAPAGQDAPGLSRAHTRRQVLAVSSEFGFRSWQQVAVGTATS